MSDFIQGLLRPPVQPPVGPPMMPPAPPVDPVAEALKAFHEGKATPKQKEMVASMPMPVVNQTTSPKPSAQQELGAGATVGKSPGASMPPKEVWEASTAAKPVAFSSLPLEQRPDNLRAGQDMLVPKTPQGLTPTPYAGATPQPLRAPVTMPIAQMPVQPVTDKGPPTIVSGALVQQGLTKGGPHGAQTVAKAMEAPVGKEQVAVAQDAMDKFLKANPDGATLANILDAVGVALSAYGGTQRQTALQQRKAAELQLAQQKSLKAQDNAQQLQMAQVQLDNQKQLLTQEYNNALAQGDHSRAQDMANKLIEIEAQKKANIDQITAQLGLGAATAGGGHTGRVANWVTPGGN